eukprot:7034269-Pyramimonas_sp.AAC.1
MTAPDKRGRSQRSRSGSWFKGGTIRILVTTGTWSRIEGGARMASIFRHSLPPDNAMLSRASPSTKRNVHEQSKHNMETFGGF